MRFSFSVVVVVVAVLILCPATVSAQNGPDIGACGIEFSAGGQEAVECIDGFTQSECASFCSSCEWIAAETCSDLKVPWEGSCFFANEPPGGGCWLWAIEPGNQTAEFHCEQTFNGVWSDDLACGGGPVPTLPKIAYAALALVLLAGTLTLLTVTGRR